MAGKAASERGQSTPLVMCVLFALTLFTAVVVNLGQAVNRRIALQIVADTGAFTGASSMAVGLNNIAYWNGWIQKIWAGMTWVTFGFTATFLKCETTTSAADLYDGGRAVLAGFIWTVNHGYVAHPNGEARRVSDYNAADLFPGEKLSYREYQLSPEVPIGPQRNFTSLYDLEEVPEGSESYAATWALGGSRGFAEWGCLPSAPPPFDYPVRAHNFKTWFRKAPDAGTAHFVWIVKAEATQALMFNDLFTAFSDAGSCSPSSPSGCAIPAMTAAAAAKPVGGSIEHAESTYVAKMVPLSNVMPNVGPLTAIYDMALGKLRPVIH